MKKSPVLNAERCRKMMRSHLRSYLRKHNMTQAEFAHKVMKMRPDNFCHLLNDTITLNNLERFARAVDKELVIILRER